MVKRHAGSGPGGIAEKRITKSSRSAVRSLGEPGDIFNAICPSCLCVNFKSKEGRQNVADDFTKETKHFDVDKIHMGSNHENKQKGKGGEGGGCWAQLSAPEPCESPRTGGKLILSSRTVCLQNCKPSGRQLVTNDKFKKLVRHASTS
jgi:hypothetical protein